MIKVRKISYDELRGASNFDALVQEYDQESSVEGLPPANPQHEMYLAMERVNVLHIFGAYDGDQLIGFVNMLTTVLPHYGVKGATVESIFVAGSHRKTGAGMRLIRQVEQFAKDEGCHCVLLSAPTGSRLASIVPRVGYKHSNEIYFRRID